MGLPNYYISKILVTAHYKDTTYSTRTSLQAFPADDLDHAYQQIGKEEFLNDVFESARNNAWDYQKIDDDAEGITGWTYDMQRIDPGLMTEFVEKFIEEQADIKIPISVPVELKPVL